MTIVELTIFIGDKSVILDIEMNDTPVSAALIKELPISSRVMTWGDEIYFDTGLDIPGGEGTLEVDPGDVAYWPEGRCVCLFFGRTPMSRDERPVPASEVVLLGRARGVDPEILRGVLPGTGIEMG